MKLYITIFSCFVLFGLAAQNQNSVLPSDTMIDRYAQQQTNIVIQEIPKHLFIKASLNKKEVYTGEPLSVSYKLYALYDYQLINPLQPNFENCSVVELNIPDTGTIEPYNDLLYHVTVLRKVQLTPLQAGTLYIDTSTMPINVMIRSTEYPYDYHNYKTTITAPTQTIRVKALPQKGRPGDFKNVTGRFNIETKISDTSSTTGQTNHFIISIKGQGNFDAINAPIVNWPQGVEFFDATDSQYIRTDSFPVSGEKVFDFPFVVKTPGLVQLPAVRFSFFNPSKGNYETKISTALSFSVQAAMPNNIQLFPMDIIDNRKLLWIVPTLAIIVFSILFIRNRIQSTKKKAVLQDPKIIADNIPQNIYTTTEVRKSILFDQTMISNLDTDNDNTAFLSLTADIINKWLTVQTGIEYFNIRNFDAILLTKGIEQSHIDTIKNIQQQIQTYMYAKGNFEPDKHAIKDALMKLPLV